MIPHWAWAYFSRPAADASKPNGIKQNLRVITLGYIAGVDGHHRYHLIMGAGFCRELINLGRNPM